MPQMASDVIMITSINNLQCCVLSIPLIQKIRKLIPLKRLRIVRPLQIARRSIDSADTTVHRPIELPLDSSPMLRCLTMLIDTHIHLDDVRYNEDREAVITRAREAGVEAFVTIGCDLTTSQAAVALADRFPFVYTSIGVHPHEVKHVRDGWYDEFRRLAKNKSVVAYGEIGLDYHYNHSSPNEQRDRFREQIQVARELMLPVIIHTREAQEDTITILKEERASEVGGVIHCFSGDSWLAKEALGLGFYLSFSGILTFQNAVPLREIAKNTPLDHILIETDSPYLTPVPYRGKRNEPAYVSQVAKQLAVLHPELSLDDVQRITTMNAKRLFKIS